MYCVFRMLVSTQYSLSLGYTCYSHIVTHTKLCIDMRYRRWNRPLPRKHYYLNGTDYKTQRALRFRNRLGRFSLVIICETNYNHRSRWCMIGEQSRSKAILDMWATEKIPMLKAHISYADMRGALVHKTL